MKSSQELETEAWHLENEANTLENAALSLYYQNHGIPAQANIQRAQTLRTEAQCATKSSRELDNEAGQLENEANTLENAAISLYYQNHGIPAQVNMQRAQTLRADAGRKRDAAHRLRCQLSGSQLEAAIYEAAQKGALQGAQQAATSTNSKSPSYVTSNLLSTVLQAKGITVEYGTCLWDVSQSTCRSVESFEWTSSETEEQATGRAAAHLQKHYAPDGVRVIALPGQEWLKPIEAVVDGRVFKIRRGKTDIIFYADNAASHAKLNELAAQLSNRQTRAAQQRAASRDSAQPQNSIGKRQRESQSSDADSEDDGMELAGNDAKHKIDQLLEQLIFFIVGVYEIKTPVKLARELPKLKRQAGAAHLQLAFTVGMLRQHRHPGCLVVLGDLNSNYIWQPLLPSDLSKPVNQIDAADNPADEAERAQAISFVRSSLQELASSPAMRIINCHYSEKPSFDDDTDEDEQARRDPHQLESHQQSGRQAAQPSTQADQDQGSSQPGPAGDSCSRGAGLHEELDIGDEDRLMHALHREALTQYFADPAVYQAFGCKQPMAPPFMELDRWSAGLGARD